MKLAPLVRAWLVEHAPRLAARALELDDHELGRLGESLVARELASRGATLLARRMRTALGEVDVLARDEHGLVCVEVKSGRIAAVPMPRGHGAPIGRDPRFRPAARVDARSRERLERLAASIGVRHGRAARVEVWEALLDERTRSVTVARVERG